MVVTGPVTKPIEYESW